LIETGTLRGRVLVPPGTSPAGLRVISTAYDISSSTATDEGGRFELVCPAGRQHVDLPPKPGVLSWFPMQHHELAPGEVKEILLDASGSPGCRVKLRALVNGAPVEDLDVSLRSSSDPRRGATINRTDENGATSGWTTAIGLADVRLSAPSRMPVGRFEKRADLAPNAEVVIEVDASCGRLAFEWPALPPGETLRQVEFRGTRAETGETFAPCWFRKAVAFDSDIVERSPQRCEFQYVEPGDYEWTLRVISSSDASESIERHYRKSAAVLAKDLAECVVTERERIEKPR
jgi:hypothetical protein